MESASVLPPGMAGAETIHNCPGCGNWLPDGTLVCPECNTLTYGQKLGEMAAEAQAMEQEQRWDAAAERWRGMLGLLPEQTRQAEGIRQHLAGIEGRVHAEEEQKARWTRRLGPLAPVALFLLKAKSLVFVLFKLKFFLGLFGFFGLYWALFGWKFALGFTGAIFVHEMGHFVMAKRRGLKADLPLFLPGLGAYVRWYAQGVNRDDLASISLAGPLFGLAAALACWAGFAATHRVLLLVLANTVAWLNVVQLIPVFGLDGSQAAFALSRVQRVLVAVTAVVFFALTAARNPFDTSQAANHYVFLVIAACMGWRCFTNDAPEEPHSFAMAYYLGVLLVLGMVVHLTPVLI